MAIRSITSVMCGCGKCGEVVFVIKQVLSIILLNSRKFKHGFFGRRVPTYTTIVDGSGDILTNHNEEYDVFLRRVDSFEPDSFQNCANTFTLNTSARKKIDINGSFKPFFGDTVIFDYVI